jgi:hypothetical protein
VAYQPIPPGFDFPADKDSLLKLRDTEDMHPMRKHAWMVFAGMTQPAPGGEAIWETWFTAEETFRACDSQDLSPRTIKRSHPCRVRRPETMKRVTVGKMR